MDKYEEACKKLMNEYKSGNTSLMARSKCAE